MRRPRGKSENLNTANVDTRIKQANGSLILLLTKICVHTYAYVHKYTVCGSMVALIRNKSTPGKLGTTGNPAGVKLFGAMSNVQCVTRSAIHKLLVACNCCNDSIILCKSILKRFLIDYDRQKL